MSAIMAARSMKHSILFAHFVVLLLQYSDALKLRNPMPSFTCSANTSGISDFYRQATAHNPPTDKVTLHNYELMYGIFLAPLRQAIAPPKMLEIGLGCDMAYGPGASVKLWKTFMPSIKLWEAEFNERCVERGKQRGLLDGIDVVTGDQANPSVVERWAKETGGNFDIVIDDGGHKSKQIHTSFNVLWKHVAAGGLYFIEDLQVSRTPKFNDPDVTSMIDVIEDWVEQLMIPEGKGHQRPVDYSLPEKASFLFCQSEAVVLGKAPDVEGKSSSCSASTKGIAEFRSMAKQLSPTTHKVTRHEYQLMYGIFLSPLRHARASPKMLEIGLGCDMVYGPGASVKLWKEFLPRVNLWEAEFDEQCVERSVQNGLLDGVQVVTGDQGEAADVQRWVTETGGNFDVVVDDGGHHSKHFLTSFQVLWPHVVPGGLYMIENLEASRTLNFVDTGVPSMADVIEDWIEQLVIRKGEDVEGGERRAVENLLPTGVSFIFCQAEACVIGKDAQSPAKM
mmetsp:Transcript_71143/g.123395  ORF Transcript_71143/g.123395 Transcript_71143/m.123395 type:complete len:507 (+) Transcript_71143:45-1565(+)